MTHRQRLLAAMRREEVDRIPCSPRLGVALCILYDEPEGEWNGLALRAAEDSDIDLDPHFVVGSGVPCAVENTTADTTGLPHANCRSEVADDGGCELIRRTFHTPDGTLTELIRQPKPGRVEYGLSPNPIRLEHLVKSPADLPALRHLLHDPAACPAGEYARRFAAEVGERGLVEVCIRSPLDHRAGIVRAMTDLMLDYYEDRPFFDTLLGLFHARMLAETRAVLEAGAEVIFGSWYYTSLSAGWSPAIFREVFLPMIREHVALVHSYGALYDYYDDGKCMGILDMVADAGVDCLETLTPPPMGDVDLAEVKRRIGDRVCLKGYVDLLYVIKHGTPELIEQTVREACRVAGPTGFILGTCDSIREGTPRENVAAYFRAARECGRLA